MISLDKKIKESAEAFIPEATEAYEDMVSKTVSELRQKAGRPLRKRRVLKRAICAAAAVLSALVIASAAVFGARPALASELPVLSGIVYAASPKKAAGEADRARIGELTEKVFRCFASRDYTAAEECFCGGGFHTRSAYLAAAYTDSLLDFEDALPGDADAGEIVIEDISAEQKAFCFTGVVKLNFISRDGVGSRVEECIVLIRENREGMQIESIEMQSEKYLNFVCSYEKALGPVPPEGGSFTLISIANRCMWFDAVKSGFGGISHWRSFCEDLLRELELVSAPDGEKAPLLYIIQAEIDRAKAELTPAMLTYEEAAAELMYRYWLGAKTGEMSDFSDIMEHNGQTDLFLKDAQLRVDAVDLGAHERLDSVKKGHAELHSVSMNSDGTVTAYLFVQTDITCGIMSGVGEEIVLTLRSTDEGFIIVGFDREAGDGLYVYTLKPCAIKLKAAGIPWQEADQTAYEQAYAELEASAGR